MSECLPELREKIDWNKWLYDKGMSSQETDVEYVKRKAWEALEEICSKYGMTADCIQTSTKSLLLWWMKDWHLFHATIPFSLVRDSMSIYEPVQKAVRLQLIRVKKGTL